MSSDTQSYNPIVATLATSIVTTIDAIRQLAKESLQSKREYIPDLMNELYMSAYKMKDCLIEEPPHSE